MSDREMRRLLEEVMADIDAGRVQPWRPRLLRWAAPPLLAASLGLAGCGDRSIGTSDADIPATVDASVDAGPSVEYMAPFDASVDAGPAVDAAYMAPFDASVDSGPSVDYAAPFDAGTDSGATVEYGAPFDGSVEDGGPVPLYMSPEPG